MTSSAAQLRTILVALNASRELGREAICRLGRRVELWVGSTAPSPSLAADLRVTPRSLERALRLAEGADGVAARELEGAARLGANLITRFDAEYPDALLELELPPPVLYCRGRLPGPAGIAVVGPRQPDAYGIAAAEMLTRSLAERGLVITSGFARGIDIVAHRVAIGAGGETVAVVGCGLAVDYPRSHAREQATIAEHGAVLSEFPLTELPLPRNFPIRNRLIAALSLGTIVIQASRRSGALVTARYALELGRPVFALPGPIFEPLCQGSNRLLRDGAHLVEGPEDVVVTLPAAVQAGLGPPADRPPRRRRRKGAPPGFQGELLRTLHPSQRRRPEELALLLAAPVDRILATLLELELAGLVTRHPGPAFCAKPCDRR